MPYKQIITAAILLEALSPVAAKSLKSSLRDCGEIKSNEQRLVCFDKLLESENHKTDANDQSPAPITDDFGLATPQEEPEANARHSVVITSCESSTSSKRLFFHLDNG